MQQDWWTKAWDHDSRRLDNVVRGHEERNKRVRQLILDGIDASLAKVFPIMAGGKVESKIEVKSFDDLAKLMRINDYLTAPDNRDPKDLSDVTNFHTNYHMAIVQAIQGAEAEYTQSERIQDGWTEDTRRIPRVHAGQIVESHASLQDPGQKKKNRKSSSELNPAPNHSETTRP